MRILILLVVLISFSMEAQDLEKHQWKSRIIVITSPSFESKEAAIQKNYFQSKIEGLIDRKLIVYHITNEGYTVDFDSEIVVSKNNAIEIAGFNVSLVGLDGTSKYQSTTPQLAAIFFGLIDTMPIRQAELRNR